MNLRHNSPWLKNLYYCSWSAVALYFILSAAQCSKGNYGSSTRGHFLYINTPAEEAVFKQDLECWIKEQHFSASTKPKDFFNLPQGFGNHNSNLKETHYYQGNIAANRHLYMEVNFANTQNYKYSSCDIGLAWGYFGYAFQRPAVKKAYQNLTSALGSFREEQTKKFEQ